MSQAIKITPYCSMPKVPEKKFNTHMDPHRLNILIYIDKVWVNGTVLHYYFFDKETDGEYVFTDDGLEWRTWTTNEDEKNVVREAFKKWKDVGIGLQFKEVSTREEAEVRIGFMRGDGAWSFLGTDIINPELNIGKDQRTMNFGWNLIPSNPNLDIDIDTAMHEIGHTLGLPHEHQSDNAGIVWNKEAVYAYTAASPNNWNKETTDKNILNKIPKNEVIGSDWDPNSIMHYSFPAGLIISPEEYQNGIYPKPGLSKHDKQWIRKIYPSLNDNDLEVLSPFVSSKLMLNNAEQKSFIIKPKETRKYNIATFGTSDSVLVLYEKNNDDPIYITADNDSGDDYNANINVRLYRNKEYILRVRLNYSPRPNETAVMYW